FFFFQAGGVIRFFHVTGVQTCALPIWSTLGLFSNWVFPILTLYSITSIRPNLRIRSSLPSSWKRAMRKFITRRILQSIRRLYIRSEERRVGKDNIAGVGGMRA